MPSLFSDADVIHVHSRADAIADGDLIDVSADAKEVGFKVPVALTRAAWADCVEWDEEDSKRQVYQDQAGRLWDVLNMCIQTARHVSGAMDADRFYFVLCRVPRGGQAVRPRIARLKATIAGGDNGEAVVTIMMPHED